jgi:hypothetical protein
VIRPGGAVDGEPVMLELRLPDGEVVYVTMSRRHFSQFLAAAALSPILPGAIAADHGESTRITRAIEQPALIDDEVIGYLRRLLAEHYAADKMLGPRLLLGPVLAQIETIDELRKGARQRYEQPLMRVLAQYGEMAGWLEQDIGNLGAAAHWTRRAAEWAHRAGDSQLAAYMLIRQSNVAWLTDDRHAVVQLAAAARRLHGPADQKLVALAIQQEARGHALLGDFGTCFTLLDQAAGILGGHRGPVDPNARSTCITRSQRSGRTDRRLLPRGRAGRYGHRHPGKQDQCYAGEPDPRPRSPHRQARCHRGPEPASGP